MFKIIFRAVRISIRLGLLIWLRLVLGFDLF
jgi:hypothetical protein